jgi:hypothetical protein
MAEVVFGDRQSLLSHIVSARLTAPDARSAPESPQHHSGLLGPHYKPYNWTRILKIAHPA